MKFYFLVYFEGYEGVPLYNVEVIDKSSRKALIKYLAEAKRENIDLFHGKPIAMLNDYQWKKAKELAKTTFNAVSKKHKSRWWLK